MVFVLEVPVQLDDVGVAQAVMDLQLSRELLFHLVVFDGRLEDLLDGADEPCLFVDAQVDIPELARADAFAQLKVTDLHGLLRGFCLKLLEDVVSLSRLLDINRVAIVCFVGYVCGVFLQGQGVAVHDKLRGEYLFPFFLAQLPVMGFLLIVILLFLVAIIDDPFRMVVVELQFLPALALRLRLLEGIRELLFDFFDLGEEHIDGG